MKTIKAGIVGGAGYTGGELLRLLLYHPDTEIAFVHSKSNAGNPVHTVHADLLGETELQFAADITDADVLFLCTGHGEAKKFLEAHTLAESTRIIDLSQDFRLVKDHRQQSRDFVYGLPELNREEIKTARNIANPGCFATAIQLGLLPLAKAGLLKAVHTTGITGSTGAGQGLNATSHFSWRANNIQAYKTLTHQHLKEIMQSLQQLQPAGSMEVNFIPWRGDFTRGIFTSSLVDCTLPEEEAFALFSDYYITHPFTTVTSAPVFLKQVVNTNKCIIQVEKIAQKLVVHTAIDNLLKGASGQAVQNMNLMFGLPEETGLKLKASYF